MDARGLLLFLHVVGFALWFGVTLTLALLVVRANRAGDAAAVGFVYRASSRLLRGPGLIGMLLTILSGFGLTGVAGYALFRPFPNHWLFQMQLLGVLAFLLAVFVQLPNAERLARAAEASAAAGEASASFLRFRKRNAIVSSIVGTLLLVVALLGTARPGG